MLLPMALVEPIRQGTVTLAFRSWKRPTVRPGGTLLTAAGLLGIDEVTPIDPSDVTERDAQAAGAASLDDLAAWLRPEPDRKLYRIRFHRIGDDPRIALRDDDGIDAATRDELDAKLAAWDRRSSTGPWTAATLRVIADAPGVVSTELAEQLGAERAPFKRRVRQLKELGLTESLEVGYRLSPRGERYWRGREGPGGGPPGAPDRGP
jgi:hypothetical protein